MDWMGFKGIVLGVILFGLVVVVISYESKIRAVAPLGGFSWKEILLRFGVTIAILVVLGGWLAPSPLASNYPYQHILEPVITWPIFFFGTYLPSFVITYLIFKFLKPDQPKTALVILSIQPTTLLVLLLIFGGWNAKT